MPSAERKKIVDRLIEQGLRAQLVTQSMVTGQLMVSLDFYPNKPAIFVGDGTIPEIPTIPSTREELSGAIEKLNLEELAIKLSATLSGIERKINSPEVDEIISERKINSPEVDEIISGVNGTVKDIRKLVQNVDSRIEPLTNTVEQTLQDFDKVAQDADKQIEPIAKDADLALKDIRGLVKNLDGVVKKIDAAAEPLPETMANMKRISRDLGELISSQRPNLQRTIENFRASSQNFRDISEDAKRDPSGILFGKPPPQPKKGKKGKK
jgi:paraquat-inducible protein B